MSSKYYTGQEHLKKRSRDAARCRRGQQNDEYSELANQLPLSQNDASQLDRLSVMRLTNSFIKVKHFLKNIKNKDPINYKVKQECGGDNFENQLLQALDGFVFVIGPDGQCLYVSDNVTTYLGLMPIEVTGNSFYKFIHPCDHEEVAKELGGKIPLEDMEIFDGLFCSDSVFVMSNNLKGGSTNKRDDDRQPYRSFFVRMKSTLTSRGKNVNLKASTYRVVHCMGCMKTSLGEESKVSFVGIGVPLMFTPTFEVPLDRCTFTSHHALDLKFIYCEEGIQDILGYPASEVIGRSLYEIHHGSDSAVLTNCHKTLLTKGQSVSGYYRLLASCGGWVWVQTKASIVYATKSCQPQFVLCVHYAISGVQKEDCVVSLDQLRGLPESQDSPRNSPTSKPSASAKYARKVAGSQLNVVKLGNDLNEVKQSNNGDNADVDARYLGKTKVVEDEDGLDAEEALDVEEASLTPPMLDSVSPADSVAATPTHDTSFYADSLEANQDRWAPFIPPPLVDATFLTSSVDFFSMGDDMDEECMMWNTEHWEIYDSSDSFTSKNNGCVQRNLSTPKFYPEADEELPVLKSEEIEMSTPVQNLPLLQGNEIWFALDQSKEVMT